MDLKGNTECQVKMGVCVVEMRVFFENGSLCCENESLFFTQLHKLPLLKNNTIIENKYHFLIILLSFSQHKLPFSKNKLHFHNKSSIFEKQTPFQFTIQLPFSKIKLPFSQHFRKSTPIFITQIPIFELNKLMFTTQTSILTKQTPIFKKKPPILHKQRCPFKAFVVST